MFSFKIHPSLKAVQAILVMSGHQDKYLGVQNSLLFSTHHSNSKVLASLSFADIGK